MSRAKVLLSRMIEPILWTLSLLPLHLMISASQTGGLLPGCICLLLVLLFGCTLVSMKKHRLLMAVAGALCLFLAMYPWFHLLGMLFIPLTGSAVLFYTASAKSQEKAYANPVFRTICAVLLYLAAQYGISRGHVATFQHFGILQVPVIAGFLLFFLIELFIVNRTTIQDEAVGDSIPSSVIRHNQLLVVGAFLICVIIACIPAIGNAVSTVWGWIRSAVRYIVSFLLSLLPETQQGGGGGGGADLAGLMAGEAAEPSLLAIWLERIVAVIAGAALVVLVFLGFRVLFRKLKKAFQRMKDWLFGYMKNTTLDYTDEISDTRNTKEGYMSTFFRRRKKRPYHNDMSNAEKVRYMYGVMVDQHPDWEQSATAREKLGISNSEIYEKVRYAETDVSTDETEQFRTILQMKKAAGKSGSKT